MIFCRVKESRKYGISTNHSKKCNGCETWKLIERSKRTLEITEM
jgi:hypothetical protein